MEIREGLTFDDVLLEPKHSTIKSRALVDTSVELPKNFVFKHPIIPANMKSITGFAMARAVAESGGLALVNRFSSLENQLDIANEFILMAEVGTLDYQMHVGYSVGVKEEDKQIVDALIDLGAAILCIDVAHGDSEMCINMCNYIANKYPKILLIAGNVATGRAAENLWKAGVDVVKVGIGPGSLCSTRIETGCGVPQLTALMEVASKREILTNDHSYRGVTKISRKLGIIADGGIKNSGDMVKALCFADMVMSGNMFAGSDEASGEVVWKDGKKYKEYNGSSTHKDTHIEGVKSIAKSKGPAQDIINKLLEGIRSGCSYQGCINLSELKNGAKFIKISSAGLRESHPHDIIKE